MDRPRPEPWHRGDGMLVRHVTPGYFRALGTPLLKAAFSTTAIAPKPTGVAIVNQAS